ncbi:hypothetical protein R50912_33225 [Paenibacillus sp. FSL R5-0912]|nr:hypothetical protein R50912_33225 [Paenibacillus sp. FSL R5-0912]
MIKSNMERQLEIQKEICMLSKKIITAAPEDLAFYDSIGQLYVLKLKEIQEECLTLKSDNCVVIPSNC